jgi:hypothetical protein
MAQISENFLELTDLDPVLTEIFFMHYDQHPQMRQAVYAMRTSSKRKETVSTKRYAMTMR